VQAAVEALVRVALEAEMTKAVGAEKGERTETRIACRSGYYTRSLITRVGTLELRVSQNRLDRFSTELFERYLRWKKAFSTINKSLDEALDKFAQRRLGEPFTYLILDARYERVREAGIILSQAVLIAVAVDGEGHRQILGIELEFSSA
jgi:transposase-like protein